MTSSFFSCATCAHSLSRCIVDLGGDRYPALQALSQRNCPALASIATALEPADAPTQLVLTAPGADRPLIVPLQRGKASGGSTAGGSGPPIPSAAVASSSSSFGGKPGGMPQRADSWGWWDSAGGTTDSQLDLVKLDVEPGSVVGFKAREGRG